MFLTDDELYQRILEKKLLDEKKLALVKAETERSKRSLLTEILDSGLLSEEQIGRIESEKLNIPFIDLSKISISEELFHILPERIVRKQRVVIFSRDQNVIKVAMVNPTRSDIVAMIGKKTGMKIEVYLATKSDIDRYLQLFRRDLQKAVDILLKEDSGRIRKPGVDDPPVANIVELLISTAYEEHSSDIHIEPQENDSVIRLRIDGILQESLRVSKLLHDRIVTRIKVLSNLRTDEHLSAQDGKMKLMIEESRLDIRVSIVPIVDGEKVVLRLLASNMKHYSLSDLGMSKSDLEKVTRAYNKSYGMILSTGPTGSGKTTTIYSILKILNSPEKNITSIEDPVEYRILGANQIQVNTKTNLTFANGLRSILRQDPNVIFVGEIRDNETAGIAVNAALTGHLVLSTLHTNDAATALPRLTDMKVEEFLVASTVTVIIAQRLVRKICQGCKSPTETDVADLQRFFSAELMSKVFPDGVHLFKGTGCKLCRNTGYNGRLGLYEVLEVTPSIRKLIVEKTDADIISQAAHQEGMVPMIEDGLTKVAQGLTTISELLRVTKAEFI